MDITETLFDESLQFEAIIFLPGCSAHPTEALRDMLYMDQDEAQEALTEAGIDLNLESLDLDDRDLDDFLATCARKRLNGFFVRVNTPFPQGFFGESGYSYSWGHTTWKWFYTPAIDDSFVERLVKWREEFVAKCRAREQGKEHNE